MTLKEQLVEKKAALAALEEDIKAGNEDAIIQGEEINNEINDLVKSIEKAEKADALLAQIGTNEKPEETGMEERTGLKAMNLESIKGARGSVSTYIKAATDNEVTTPIIDTDKKVVDIMPQLGVRGLFGAESISGNALTYFVMGALEGEPAVTAEGAAKPQIHIPYEPKTAALAKIACFMKETDELLSDAAFLESAIRSRGVYEFNKAVEDYLVSTLIATSGVQTGGNTITFDTILAAKQDIFADTGYAPDALLINPADWATLLQTKDSNLQYLLGGPAYGSYGNGAYNANPRIWGLNVVESAAVPAGKAVVGAFKAAASVVTKAGEGLRVEVSNSDQDDFIKNRVTVRIEERLLEAVRVPAAFEIIGQ